MKPVDFRFIPNAVHIMIHELESYYDDNSLEIGDSDFYESVRNLVKDGVQLSQKQFERLKEIYKDYVDEDS